MTNLVQIATVDNDSMMKFFNSTNSPATFGNSELISRSQPFIDWCKVMQQPSALNVGWRLLVTVQDVGTKKVNSDTVFILGLLTYLPHLKNKFIRIDSSKFLDCI